MRIALGAALSSPAAAQLQPRPTHEPVIRRIDPRFGALVPLNAELQKIVDDHGWAEGPVWVRNGGYLLFSDVVKNRIYRWKEGEGESVFLERSGYTGAAPFAGPEPGSNGLAIDREGRLVFCQHGNRSISRREADGHITVLVDRYRGKRINSPNDLAFKSNGDLYFTDPPFGLPRTFGDTAKDLAFQGVYRLSRDGKLTLLTTVLSAPNGIAFSPDERTLYVSNADRNRLVWLAFEVRSDGTLGRSRLLYDGTEPLAGRPGTADGLKVDRQGNVFGAGPGGVYVFSSAGVLLGWFDFGGNVGNVAWGEDGSSLFIAANAAVYRVRLTTRMAGR
ncbi:MAG TPA: SMP-30/gluconolactonase/LRE family protein [Gemmatimonadales bacterium]|nr:SMP-30/gluconolactonase/LRE family protein [Gemmatimonadales bacterium]